MNREIKFRAWDGEKFYYFTALSGLYGVLNLIVQQFTGLKDKNGKDIYEGDIVQTPNWRYPFEIIYKLPKCKFCCKINESHTTESIPLDSVVIGNVFENPELINQ